MELRVLNKEDKKICKNNCTLCGVRELICICMQDYNLMAMICASVYNDENGRIVLCSSVGWPSGHNILFANRVATSIQCCFLVLWTTTDSVLCLPAIWQPVTIFRIRILQNDNHVTFFRVCLQCDRPITVLWFFVELPPDHCTLGFTVGWPHHHSVLCFSIRWILGRICVFYYSVKSWSQCFTFLCLMVTWTCFSMFRCRLRPYHNDVFSAGWPPDSPVCVQQRRT